MPNNFWKFKRVLRILLGLCIVTYFPKILNQIPKDIYLLFMHLCATLFTDIVCNNIIYSLHISVKKSEIFHFMVTTISNKFLIGIIVL